MNLESIPLPRKRLREIASNSTTAVGGSTSVKQDDVKVLPAAPGTSKPFYPLCTSSGKKRRQNVKDLRNLEVGAGFKIAQRTWGPGMHAQKKIRRVIHAKGVEGAEIRGKSEREME